MGELGSILESALRQNSLKTIRTLWLPISEFKLHACALPVLIASKELIDPIVNPEGIGLAWYHSDEETFIVPVGNPDFPRIETLKLPKSDVTHFLPTQGPY